MVKPLGIVIFACLTKPKYRQQAEDCFATWVQDALAADCIVRFYCEDIPEDIDPALKALCINVKFGDAYHSALFKQWRGLEHCFYELEPCAWYFTCGTDTFVYMRNALSMLKDHAETQRLCIGGNRGEEEVGGEPIQYFSGGCGIFMTSNACEAMCEKLPEFIHWWIQTELRIQCKIIGDELQRKSVFGASDLQIGVLCKWLDIEEISVGVEKMNGYSKYPELKDCIHQMISWHNLLHHEFYECAERLATKKIGVASRDSE
jgi:hypothetical protein